MRPVKVEAIVLREAMLQSRAREETVRAGERSGASYVSIYFIMQSHEGAVLSGAGKRVVAPGGTEGAKGEAC